MASLLAARFSGTEPAPSSPPPSAVVVAGDEETRVLLRGLLKLHRFRVVGEAAGSSAAEPLVGEHRPSVLVVDATLSEGSIDWLLTATRSRSPGTRIVLLVPHGGRAGPDGTTRPDATVTRPFRIREFVEALTVPTKAPDS